MSESTSTASVERRLQISLFALRLTIAWFLLQWAIEKFIAPETTARIFGFFYKMPLDVSVAPVVGAIQMVIVLAFLAGFMKTWSYALVALMHGVATFSTWKCLTSAPMEQTSLIA